MLSALIHYAAVAVCFFAIDFVWLSLMAKRLYKPAIGEALLRDTPALVPAAAFYVIYTAVLTLLVVAPAVRAGAQMQALWQGALFGLAAYATYNLTNASTLKQWPLSVTLVDTTWGAVLTGLTAYAAALIIPRLI